MHSDHSFDGGEVLQRVEQIHRRHCVVTAEGQQVPVVVAHPQAWAKRLCAVLRKNQSAAAIVSDPGHPHMLVFSDLELAQRKTKGLSHARDVGAQKLHVVSP